MSPDGAVTTALHAGLAGSREVFLGKKLLALGSAGAEGAAEGTCGLNLWRWPSPAAECLGRRFGKGDSPSLKRFALLRLRPLTGPGWAATCRAGAFELLHFSACLSPKEPRGCERSWALHGQGWGCLCWAQPAAAMIHPCLLPWGAPWAAAAEEGRGWDVRAAPLPPPHRCWSSRQAGALWRSPALSPASGKWK